MKPRTPCRLRVSLVLLTLRFAPGLSESRVAHYAHVQLDAVRETLTVDGKQRSFVWQAPGRAPPAGLMLLVRGCDHPEDEHGWPPSASCPKCQSLPEEEYIVRAALDARLLVASPAPAGFCPELDADLPLIVELLRSLQGRAASPLRLFATGSSSGGRIVARLPSRLPADLALSAFSPSCANPAARLLLPVVGGGEARSRLCFPVSLLLSLRLRLR